MKTFKGSFFSAFLGLVLLTVSGFTPETGTLQYYKGTIGNNTQIQMSLQLEGIQMNGSYINEASGEVFVLTGFIGEITQSVVLDVKNDNC